MIKTLIIEDEVLARAGLHSLINWEENGFCLISDAKDCLDAIEIIQKESPDLLLLDINTPGMNGIELMEWLKKNNRFPTIIVISCLENFDTTKTALQLGAFDYIRKLNLSKEELESCLLRAKNHILNEKGKDTAAAFERTVVNSDFISDEYMRKLGEAFTTGFCFSILLSYKEIYMEKEIQAVLPVIRTSFSSKHIPFAAFIRNNSVIILCACNYTKEIVSDIWNELKEQGLCFYIGISTEWSNLRNIKRKIRIASQIETVAFYKADKYLHVFEEIVEYSYNYSDWFLPKYERIKNGLGAFDFMEIKKQLTEVFHEIRIRKNLNIGAIRRITMDLLSEFSMCAVSLGGNIEEVAIEETGSNYNILITCDTLEELQETFIQFADQFENVFLLKRQIKKSEIIRDVIAYINANLSSSITLREIAKEINVSEAYLSSYFKKEMKENLISFVNRSKIEKAKDLISGGILISTVSEQLGYSDPTYFSKVFKRYTGMTPENYRKIIEVEKTGDL